MALSTASMRSATSALRAEHKRRGSFLFAHYCRSLRLLPVSLGERVGPGATATLARRPSERPLRRPCRSEADAPCSSLRYAWSLAAPRPPRRHAPPGPRLLERRAEILRVHHVGPLREALRVTAAILDPDPCREGRRRALKLGSGAQRSSRSLRFASANSTSESEPESCSRLSFSICPATSSAAGFACWPAAPAAC